MSYPKLRYAIPVGTGSYNDLLGGSEPDAAGSRVRNEPGDGSTPPARSCARSATSEAGTVPRSRGAWQPSPDHLGHLAVSRAPPERRPCPSRTDTSCPTPRPGGGTASGRSDRGAKRREHKTAGAVAIGSTLPPRAAAGRSRGPAGAECFFFFRRLNVVERLRCKKIRWVAWCGGFFSDQNVVMVLDVEGSLFPPFRSPLRCVRCKMFE